jgi:predicted metal-dependent phosphoesterase TrpH
MHSTVSDGTDEPAALARRVVAAGLTAAALTDHDSVEGSDEFAAVLDAAGIEAVRACEISCLQDDGVHSAHLLCYFIGEGPDELHDVLGSLRHDRATRNERLVAQLAEIGYPLDVERIEAIGDKPLVDVGRPHFAEALIEAYPSDFGSINGVFTRLLGDGGAAYVPKARVSIAEATASARRSGAVSVLAHPLTTFCPRTATESPTLAEQRSVLDEAFARAADQGVSGAEAYYARHTPEEVAMVAELCSRHGLVATGGSDYHGTKKPDLAVGIGVKSQRGTTGQLRVPDTALTELAERRPA